MKHVFFLNKLCHSCFSFKLIFTFGNFVCRHNEPDLTVYICRKERSKVVELLVEKVGVDERVELLAVGRLEHRLVVEKALEDLAVLDVEEAPQLVHVRRIRLLVVQARLRVVRAHHAAGFLLHTQRRLARLVHVLERHAAQLLHVLSDLNEKMSVWILWG